MHHYPPPDRLVADSEREPFIETLRKGFTDGRLTQEEFDQRLDMVLAARTHAQLAPILAGLPWIGEPEGQLTGVQSATEGSSVAAAAHALGILTSFIGPLVIYLIVKKNGSSFARTQAAEALNFQLSFLLFSAVTFGFGYLIFPIVWIYCIIAAANAGNGRPYRYRFALRLVH
jgi:uncharacterized protein